MPRLIKRVYLNKSAMVSLVVVAALGVTGIIYAAVTWKTPVNVVSTTNNKSDIVGGTVVIADHPAGIAEVVWYNWGPLPGDNGLDPTPQTVPPGGSTFLSYLDIEFTETSCSDSEVGTGYDVGTVVCGLSDTDGDGDMDKVVITIGNAYPCYTATCWLTVRNNGTIPAHLTVAIVSASPELDVSNDPSQVIEPSESKTFDVRIHVKEGAKELSTYTASLTVTAKRLYWSSS